MDKITMKRYKESLRHDENASFYNELEKHTSPLRLCAHDMVECIDHLAIQTNELHALRQSYAQLEEMPVKGLHRGIETINTEFSNINLIADENNVTSFRQRQLAIFFKQQNKFNTEANLLVKKAMQMERLN